MRFGYVLLGLATLISLHISSGQQCTNGLAGVQNDDVCCSAICGTCGGNDCAERLGGAMNCCVGAITESGVMCSTTMAAPCIVDDGVVCSNGLFGVEEDHICCEAQCGTCGDSQCGRRPGGRSSCCINAITASGDMCSDTMAAPCIIDDAVVCSNGLHGVERDGVCCEARCGTCGGRDCAGRPGGSSACCFDEIADSGVLCSMTSEAPCIIDDETLCSNGVLGVERDGICCDARCGTCGGRGCSSRPGSTSSCCTGAIEESGVFCSVARRGPCIIDVL